METKRCRAGSYSRLSREDGDKPESDSIINQQRLIRDYCALSEKIELTETYADDGFTGTNFQRPGFQRMISDIESGKIDCVIVKDLSRFGRDYIDMGYYLERYFPSKGVRFIAINDHIDSFLRQYDMMLPLKNVFNTQYAKDISEKVRSAFKAKQKRGEFIGAFASYGYLKDPKNHNHLIIDPVASKVVARIFQMAASGYGQIRIAKALNDEQIPCPSAYKQMIGEKYTNNHRLTKTNYWTYSTVHTILRNELYRGNMVANRYFRPSMHGKARKSQNADVIIVENTHEAIVSEQLWNSVQKIVSTNARPPTLKTHLHNFAGLIKCGDCGRAMCRKASNGKVYFCCGSYARYGPSVCSRHAIRDAEIEDIVLRDLNRIVESVKDLRRIAEEIAEKRSSESRHDAECERFKSAINRVRRLRKSAYEDYCEGLLSREEFLSYKSEYDAQESALLTQIGRLAEQKDSVPESEWVERLIRTGRIDRLDRATVVQTVKEIRVFEDRRIEIEYLFGEEMNCMG